MRIRVLALLLGAVVLVGCGSDDENEASEPAQGGATPTASASPSPSPTPTPTVAASCEEVDKPKPKDTQLDKPTEQLDPEKQYTAVVETSCGRFEIALDVERAPKTASSFAYLAREGFYDDLTFHRISPGFVVQGGDPEGVGAGGPGYQVTEKPPGNLRYDVGTVAMAKTGTDPAGTSGSQFFVVTGDGGLSLPPDYALVGTVTSGEDAVQAIATVPSDPATEQPLQPVVIESVTIEEAAGE